MSEPIRNYNELQITKEWYVENRFDLGYMHEPAVILYDDWRSRGNFTNGLEKEVGLRVVADFAFSDENDLAVAYEALNVFSRTLADLIENKRKKKVV